MGVRLRLGFSEGNEVLPDYVRCDTDYRLNHNITTRTTDTPTVDRPEGKRNDSIS